MADGYFFNQGSSFQKGRTSINCKFSIDDNGDAALFTNNGISYGVSQVEHSGDGEYLVYLGNSQTNYDKYSQFINCNVTPVYGGSPTVLGRPFISSDFSQGPNYVKLTFLAPTVASGPIYSLVPTDPPSGSIYLCNIVVKRGVAN